MPFRALVALLFASVAVAAPKGVAPETTTPYKWRVVVRVAKHPTLGPAVKRQFLADLKAALGPALGDDLGGVEIVDLDATPKERWEPLWKAFDGKGWAALDGDSLREFNTLTGVKTHFLTLHADDGKFSLACRQHDGNTGLATPRTRTRTVTDLDTVSRTAGLMLAADFAPVGTIERLPDDTENCLLRLRGGDLPGADRWVKVGDVFQFVVVQEVPLPPKGDATARPGQVIEAETEQRGLPQAFTLLRVTDRPQPGVVRCEIFTRYESPFVRGRYVAGYRAMKVSTRDGRLSVRVEDDQGKPPPPSAPLQVWATEFGPKVNPNDRDLLDRRGDLFTSPKTLHGVAVVTIKLGSGKHEYYPLPVYDHGDPPTLTFGFDQTAVRKARFENTTFRFYNRVLDARLAREELTKGMRTLMEKDEYKAALERAKAGLKTMQEEDDRLTNELTDLRQNPDAKDPAPAHTLATAERLLAGLRAANPALESSIREMEAAVARAEDPATYEKKFRADEIARQIAFHERRGEVPEALEQYDRLIELTDSADVKGKKKKLEDDGRVKTDEQAAMRNYLTSQWARITEREEFDTAIPKLRQTVEGLAKMDDKYGIRLSVTHIEGGYVRLGDLLTGLDPDFSEDKEKLLAIQKTMQSLKEVEDIAREEQKRLEGAK